MLELSMFPLVLFSVIYQVLVITIIISLKAMLIKALQIILIVVLVGLLFHTKRNGCAYCGKQETTFWLQSEDKFFRFCSVICLSWWVKKQPGFSNLVIGGFP